MRDGINWPMTTPENPCGVGAVERALKKPDTRIEKDAEAIARLAFKYWGSEGGALLAAAVERFAEWEEKTS